MRGRPGLFGEQNVSGQDTGFGAGFVVGVVFEGDAEFEPLDPSGGVDGVVGAKGSGNGYGYVVARGVGLDAGDAWQRVVPGESVAARIVLDEAHVLLMGAFDGPVEHVGGAGREVAGDHPVPVGVGVLPGHRGVARMPQGDVGRRGGCRLGVSGEFVADRVAERRRGFVTRKVGEKVGAAACS